MAHEAYADAGYYRQRYKGMEMSDELLDKGLVDASRHIDSLTYNRIRGRGFSNLTEFQQEVIREACCKMTEFEYENADMIHCVLQQYAINGVSMSFGSSWNMVVQNGVAIRRDVYEFLSQTGLCTRRLGV